MNCGFTLAYMLVLTAKLCRAPSPMLEEDKKWSSWKLLHRKSYHDIYEENFRKTVWLYNSKKMEEIKKSARTFTLELNKFADLTPAEFRHVMLGKKSKNPTRKSSGSSSFSNFLPKKVNWVERGCVTSVKNQGEFGKSYAISVVGSLEGEHCIATKRLVSLDVKKLVRCCVHCDSIVDGFQYIMAHSKENQSQPLAFNEDKNCNFSQAAYGASLTGYVQLPSGSEDELQYASAMVGPVAVSINAGLSSFQLYSGGIYDDPACSSTQLDHDVLVVGYGTLNGRDYWMVKNSWGVDWGMKGYILMSRNKNNQCGIASAAAYPTGVTMIKA